jgi:hypothetical protein
MRTVDRAWIGGATAATLGLAVALGVMTTLEPTPASSPPPAAHPVAGKPKVKAKAAKAKSKRPGGDIVVGEGGRFTRAAPLDRDIEALESIGYLSGSTLMGGQTGVGVHHRERVQPGFNLVTSGHGPEASLIDMEGQVRHTWRMAFDQALPGCSCANKSYWRRVAMLPDGGLIALFEGGGLIRLTRESELLWARCNKAHHDLEVLPDGSLWVLTRKAHVLADLHPSRPILEDFATLLSAQGEVVRSISILGAYERSEFRAHWRPRTVQGGDPLHTNTLAVIGDNAVFPAGHLLVSTRHLHTLAVIDPVSLTVVWSVKGPWRLQHDPHVLADGGVLLFDNRGLGEASRVLELAPESQQIRWSWPGEEAGAFFSRTCGTVQRLQNGNTLVTESDAGRAVEVTRSGDVVWAYHNPHRPADHPEYVATLFEVLRVAPPSWL